MNTLANMDNIMEQNLMLKTLVACIYIHVDFLLNQQRRNELRLLSLHCRNIRCLSDLYPIIKSSHGSGDRRTFEVS